MKNHTTLMHFFSILKNSVGATTPTQITSPSAPGVALRWIWSINASISVVTISVMF